MAGKGENIYKRKDGRWEGRYIKSKGYDGRTFYGYVYAKTYREVKQKLAHAIVYNKEISANTAGNTACESFHDNAAEWLKSIQPMIKESTYNKYKNLLELYILPEFGTVPINNITHDFIETWCHSLLISGGTRKSGLSAKTVSDALSVVRSILRFAQKKGQTIPCDVGDIHIKRQAKEIRVLNRGEQQKLCKYLYSNLNAHNIGILLCLFTGLRVGELCALRWEDISLKDQEIHIHQTMQRIQDKSGTNRKTKIVITAPKSPSSIRTIPIPDDLIKIIADYQITSKGYFLTNSCFCYIEPRTMQNHFKQVLEKCSINTANFHCLRHTFATRCVEVGFDTKSLSEILGHSSINITMNRYVHPSMELKKENMQRLSFLLAVR